LHYRDNIRIFYLRYENKIKISSHSLFYAVSGSTNLAMTEFVIRLVKSISLNLTKEMTNLGGMFNGEIRGCRG